jgi:hypothetical protein
MKSTVCCCEGDLAIGWLFSPEIDRAIHKQTVIRESP